MINGTKTLIYIIMPVKNANLITTTCELLQNKLKNIQVK
jgi:hypothetical protein